MRLSAEAKADSNKDYVIDRTQFINDWAERDAILFIADHGTRFLPFYRFDIHTGTWRHGNHDVAPATFGIQEALDAGPAETGAPESGEQDLDRLFDEYLREAAGFVEAGSRAWRDDGLKKTEEDLIPFVYMGDDAP